MRLPVVYNGLDTLKHREVIMIQQTCFFLSPVGIAVSAAAVFVGVQVWVRIRYALKVRAAGGVHAPSLAKDPFTGMIIVNTAV